MAAKIIISIYAFSGTSIVYCVIHSLIFSTHEIKILFGEKQAKHYIHTVRGPQKHMKSDLQ